MSTLPLETWSQMGKAAFKPILELNGITARLYSDMTRENLKTLNELMQCSAEQLQGFTRAKDMEDFVHLQAKWTLKTTPPLYQHAQKMLDMFLEGSAEYGKWLERGINQLSQDKFQADKSIQSKRKE